MVNLKTLAAELGAKLNANELTLTLAESCTGGMVAEAITRIAGSSAWFDRAFITYSNAAKIEMLGVSALTLNQFGAVSEQTALEMAVGALDTAMHKSQGALLALQDPMAVARKNLWVRSVLHGLAITFQHKPPRNTLKETVKSIRQQAAAAMLTGLIDRLIATELNKTN